ncbi:MAG: acyl-CoA desaturase [Myxococcota bacterium]
MKSIGIRFSNKRSRAFTNELKSRVDQYFEENGLSKKGTGEVAVKTVVMLSLVFVPYGLLMSGQFSLGWMWLFSFLTGAGIAGFGFGVMHDALHGAYSSHPRLNAAMGYVLDLLGGSSHLWKLRHNQMHHTFTNIHGADVDLEASTLLRLTPGAKHYWFHRYQQFYAFAAYSLASLQWIFVKDYKNLSRAEMGPYRQITHSRRRVAFEIGMKALYYVNFILLPLLILDITIWQFLVGFLTLHLTTGTIMTLVFQLAHVVEGPEHFVSEGDEVMAESWMVHQLQTTANFACTNRWLTWSLGCLNFQVEHHLFPRICSVHYPALRPIVKEVAQKHGYPYHEQPTLLTAIGSHYRTLKRLGAGAVRL